VEPGGIQQEGYNRRDTTGSERFQIDREMAREK
jgi:hypothetical protein